MTSRSSAISALAIFVFCIGLISSLAQPSPAPGAEPATVMPSVTTVPAAAQPSDHFDATAATDAYMAQIPASARARSDAYFEGGYWLILWDFLVRAPSLRCLFAQPGLVGGDAQSRRTHHALQTSTNLPVLG